MKNKKILYFMAVLPLLMSATTASGYESSVAGKTYTNGEIEEVIVDGTQRYSGTLNGSSGSNVAMDVNVDYELFKMGHNAMYTSWPTVYSLIYRVHVDVKKTYQYKTGWWFTEKKYTVMPFLSEISTRLSVSGYTNYLNIFDNGPHIEKEGHYSVREDGLDFDSTGGSLSLYNGSYYFTPVYYLDPSKTLHNGDLFFARKEIWYNSTSYDLSTKAFYDTYFPKKYTFTDVYFFGCISFASDTLPTNIDLFVDVKCGGTKDNNYNVKFLTTGSESKQLRSEEINNLVSDGYSGEIIERKYDNVVTVSKTINIL